MRHVDPGGDRPQDKSGPAVAFVGTHPGLPRLLIGRGPDAVGGAELQLSLLAQALSRRGHSVVFGLGGYDGVSECRTADGVRVVPMYRMRPGISRYRRLLRPIELVRALGGLGAETFIAMGAGAQAGIIAAYCRARRKQFVFWLASDTDAVCHVEGLSRTPKSERWLALRGLRWADVVVAQTQTQARLVREHVGRDAVVVGNIWPYDISMTPPGPEPYALWVSNIRPEKRPAMLLDIAEALPDIRFVMVGGPVKDYEQLYERIRARSATLANVEFRGYVPFEQTHRWFAEASLLVNTSAVEGFPNTYLQAWAAGKPIAGSFDPDGLLAERGLGLPFIDVAEAARKIELLWRDEAVRQRIGRVAVEYVRNHHGEEAVARRVEDMLVGSG